MTEKLYDIPDYEGLYGITNSGKVWSYYRNRWLKPHWGNNKVHVITLTKNGVHIGFSEEKLMRDMFGSHNDSEMKDIPNFDGYCATPSGLIWSKRSCKFLRQSSLDSNYLRVVLMKDNHPHTKLVHRLVATTYLPNPLNLPQVDHLNNNRKDNHVDNLEWVTNRENNIRKIERRRLYE